MPNDQHQNVQDAKDTVTAVQQLSQLLNTGLDPEALSICVQLCEAGVDPVALATCVRHMQRETARLPPSDSTKTDDVITQNVALSERRIVCGTNQQLTTNMPHAQNQNLQDAKDTFTAVQQLSQLLNTGIDPEALSICMQLCEAGVNPEALAACVQHMQKEIASLPPDSTNTDDVINQNN